MEAKLSSENARVARAAGVVGISTMLSRIFGFIRDMVVARYFGAGLATDAFFVAFRIPNLLRRLLAEGSLTVSFVPVFTEYLQVKSREEALELANVAFTVLSIILVVVSIIGVLLSPYIVTLMAPGFMKTPDKFALTVLLTKIMFPYIFFISLVALCMGILEFAEALCRPGAFARGPEPVDDRGGPVPEGFFCRTDTGACLSASWWAACCSSGCSVPALLQKGVRLRPDYNFRHPGVKRIGALMIPAAFGAAVYQINIFISTLIASFLPGGSVSFLYYADRVVELPLGVFAIAIGTASLPSLSEQVSEGEFEAMKETLSFSLRLILFIAIPATIALIALREPIISVLFQRGAFDSTSTVLTAQALFYYSLGLWAFSAIRVVISGFYALQDTTTPVKVGVAALIINTLFSVALMFPLKHGGLALATSIATSFNVITLYIILKKRIGGFLKHGFLDSVSRIFVASLIMWGLFPFDLYSSRGTTDASHITRSFCSAGLVVVGLGTFQFHHSS